MVGESTAVYGRDCERLSAHERQTDGRVALEVTEPLRLPALRRMLGAAEAVGNIVHVANRITGFEQRFARLKDDDFSQAAKCGDVVTQGDFRAAPAR